MKESIDQLRAAVARLEQKLEKLGGG